MNEIMSEGLKEALSETSEVLAHDASWLLCFLKLPKSDSDKENVDRKPKTGSC